jgi:poly-gamma-glutamate capsule biosynthesis protein CapA/YwtB (metallophosphatase superfamily)
MCFAVVKIGLVAVAMALGQGQPIEQPATFRVAASGDFLIHTPVAARARALGGGSRYDFAPLFDPVRRHIEGADLALCHIETPLVPGPPTGYPVFRTPVGLAGSAKRVGWDMCSTASNHSLDVGEYGIRTTLAALDRAKLPHHGTARSPAERRRAAVAHVKGVKVAFLAYTAISNGQAVPDPWNLNWASAGRIVADARRAKRGGAEAVIVNLHWGNEYQHAISPAQLSLAKRLTRSPNITAIVGQHAHVVQPIRRINGKPVVFGEGNLVSNQTAACCPAAAQDGLIALLDFVAPPDGPVRATRVRYVPTYVRHPDYSVQPAAPGSVSWNRTVSVAGRRQGIRPLR